MKFTIIISLYNQAKYLPKLIEAVNNQTFKDYEVIWCDDGSNDNTKEILSKAKMEKPLNYCYQKNSKNLSKNINQGIKRAKGEYCVFIMGDSFPELNYLEILDKWVKPDSIICGVRINMDGKRVVEMDYRLRKGIIPQDPVLLINNVENTATGNGLTIPTKAMGKGWDERFSLDGERAEDNEIIARLFYKGYLIWSVPQLILYHNHHKNTPLGKTKLLNKIIKEYAS